jgi:hypothetical protein
MAFSITWNENTPAVGDDAKNGYARIQDVKKGTRERIASEHDANTGTTKEWRHKFKQVSSAANRNAVTNTVDGWMCFRTDVNAIQVKRAAAATGWDTYYGAFIGETKMYQGTTASIPVGWYLSDGSTKNNFVTADLREKFIIGTKPGGGGNYDTTDPVGTPKTGGNFTRRVLKANIEAFNTNQQASLITALGNLTNIPGAGAATAINNIIKTDAALTVGTAAGSVTEIDIRPPYYALAFIVYVGLAVGD